MSGVFVNFEIQLAISDEQFSPFGTIYGDIDENVSSCIALHTLHCLRSIVVNSLYLQLDLTDQGGYLIAASALQQTDLGQARVLRESNTGFCSSC